MMRTRTIATGAGITGSADCPPAFTRSGRVPFRWAFGACAVSSPRGGSIGRAMRCGWGAPLWCLRSTLDRHNPRVMSYFYRLMSCN